MTVISMSTTVAHLVLYITLATRDSDTRSAVKSWRQVINPAAYFRVNFGTLISVKAATNLQALQGQL